MDLTFEEIEQAVHRNPILDDPKDERDFQYDEIMGAVELPKKFSLRKEMTPVKNQGLRGTCVAHGSAAVDEFWNAKEFNNAKLDLSEEYLFKRIKDVDIADYNFDGYGAYTRSACKALKNWGTCLESTCPYNSTGKEDVWKTLAVTPAMDAEALIYRIANYLSVNKDEQAIKQALVGSQAPLMMSVTLWESYRGAKVGGLIPVPQAGEKRIGGHCMCAVGYDAYGIEFKNSWGATWGDKGYVWWPWAALNNVGASIWGFVDLINNPNVMKDQLIAQNKALLQHGEEGIQAWNAGLAKGIINESSVPTTNVTKEELMIFFKRDNLLNP